jgi:nucleoside-diphosphate-sugar epimerase
VIDTSGHLPRVVEQSAQVLAGATTHYTFISTIGVYENFHKFDIDESYPLAQLEDPQNEVITDKTYGALKGLCEAVIQRYFPERALIIRPGLIVGPNDPTDRFTYWVKRVAEGGEVLAPTDQSIQFIDVRDLSKWIVQMIERGATGIYNATGPSLGFEQLLQECQQASPQKSRVTWVTEDFLLRKGVQDWVELPLWLSSKRQMAGLLHINSQKAIESGLTFRPPAETIAAILVWGRDRDIVKCQAGLEHSKEKKLLLDWKQEK